jgi:hypothetical protein
MVESRHRLRLALEALDEQRVGRQPCWEHLEGDSAVESRVESRVDLAHSSRTELAGDPVVSELAADHHFDRWIRSI